MTKNNDSEASRASEAPELQTIVTPARPWALQGHKSKRQAAHAAAGLVTAAIGEPVDLIAWKSSDNDCRLYLELNVATVVRIMKLATEVEISLSDATAALLQSRQAQVEAERQTAEYLEREERQAAETKERAIAERAIAIAASGGGPKVSLRDVNGRIDIRFPFNESAKESVKALPGAKWDAKRRLWHVANRYRKRLDALLPELESVLALDQARVEFEFLADPPPPTQKVKIDLSGTNLRISFAYEADAVRLLRTLLKRDVAWYDGNRHWLVAWRNRRHFYAILQQLDDILVKSRGHSATN